MPSGMATRTERGTPGALITFVDLSQRREMERVRNELVAEVFHERRSPIGAISMAAHFLNADFDRLGMQSVPAFLQGRLVHWDYLVAEVEYPQWDDLAAHAEHPRPEAIGLIKRFLGPDEEAHADVHGKPVHEALSVLGAEGWELVAIDHPMPSAGPSAHYYVFKRMASEEGSPRWPPPAPR